MQTVRRRSKVLMGRFEHLFPVSRSRTLEYEFANSAILQFAQQPESHCVDLGVEACDPHGSDVRVAQKSDDSLQCGMMNASVDLTQRHRSMVMLLDGRFR